MKNSDSPKRALVRMPNWLGDCVMAFPVLENLRSLFPDIGIDIAIKENMAGLGKLLPSVDRVISLPEVNDPERGKVIKSALRTDYDLLMLLPNSFRSAWEFYDTKIPVRIGYAGLLRSFFLTHSIKRPVEHSLHQAEYYRNIALELYSDLPNGPARIVIPEQAELKAKPLLPPSTKPLVGIGFSATYGSAKMWPIKHFAKLIDELAPVASIVLIGAGSEHDTEREIIKQTNQKPISLVGKTDIVELAAILKKMKLYITNDSGPMHLATALGTPTIALFGPTSPEETRPLGKEIEVVYHQADCSPCWKRECPTDHRCMQSITVGEVVELALRKISGS